MRKAWVGIVVVVLSVRAAHAQNVLLPAIASKFDATLSALQSVKSPEDVRRMVEAMDTATG